MKKLLSITMLLILVFNISGCAFFDQESYVSKDLLVTCDEEIEHVYIWEDDRNRFFMSLPNYVLFNRVAETCLRFNSVSSFYKKIKNKTLTEKELATMQKAAEIAHHDLHGEKVALPQLSEIRGLIFNKKALPFSVMWLGCSDYVLEGDIEIEGVTVPLRLRHYGFENFNDNVSSKAERKSFASDGITYDQYVWWGYDFEEDKENDYEKIATFYDFAEGNRSYRVCERELYKHTEGEEKELLMRNYDIEIKEEEAYYYVFLGAFEQSPSPKITKDFVSGFSLQGLD